jgi:hypothetical protein
MNTAVAAAAVLLAFCAPALAAPSAGQAERRQADALVADLARIIETLESLGWVMDEHEFAELTPPLLQSVCRTLPAARDLALQSVRSHSEAAGDPEALYAVDGELSDRVEAALTAQRELYALQAVVRLAASDCPFWMPPDPEFNGRQVDSDRFTLNGEFGGIAQLRRMSGTWTYGAGGLARVLGAYGFGSRTTVLAGGEFGGSALIRPDDEPTTLVVNFFPALPLVLRLHDGSWHYDLETAAVALWQEDDVRLSYGVRGGFNMGFKALKTSGVIPWAGVAVAYEHYFPSGGRAAAHFLRGGLRAGFTWDP